MNKKLFLVVVSCLLFLTACGSSSSNSKKKSSSSTTASKSADEKFIVSGYKLGEIPPIPTPFFYLILIIIITSLGAYLVVTMNLVLNPQDGIVNTLAEVSHREFGQVKFFFDCSMVALSLIISYIFTHQFTGFGIGTIASALLVGKTISIFQKIFEKYPNIM